MSEVNRSNFKLCKISYGVSQDGEGIHNPETKIFVFKSLFRLGTHYAQNRERSNVILVYFKQQLVLPCKQTELFKISKDYRAWDFTLSVDRPDQRSSGQSVCNRNNRHGLDPGSSQTKGRKIGIYGFPA